MLTAERRGAAQRLAAAAGELATSADGHAAALRVSELRKAVLHWFEIDNRQAIQSTLGPDRELTSPQGVYRHAVPTAPRPETGRGASRLRDRIIDLVRDMPPDAAARLARLFALLAHECRRVDREHRERTRRRRQTDAVASSREARAAAGGRRAERDRTIMAMYRAGYQNARIAAALEVPESTVSRTIATVLADLRRLERARRQQDDE